MATERSKRSPPVRIEPTSSAFQAAVLALYEKDVSVLFVFLRLVSEGKHF